jgi:hypothetical protein
MAGKQEGRGNSWNVKTTDFWPELARLGVWPVFLASGDQVCDRNPRRTELSESMRESSPASLIGMGRA